MITTFYPPYAFGGDAVFIHRLTNALARRGHEVDVIHCRDSYRALAKGPLPTGYANEAGVTVHGLESGVGVFSPLATQQTGQPWFKAKHIQRILAAKPFDVIHFHNVSLVGGPGILRYGDAVKLYTTHEHWLVCPTHVLFKYKREPCKRKDCLRCQFVYHRPPQLWRYTGMLRKALRHVDAFIAPSEFTRRRHLADGLDIPIAHIPYFFGSRENAQPAPAAEDIGLGARPYFLFVGRLEKLKGLQTVIPVFRNYPHADLVIAGDGDYADELRTLAEGSSHIRVLGRLTQAQLRAVYSRAVALLVPSICYEVFGIVILEAFAAHTPVIVRDLGPLPEIVAESGGGLIFHDDASLVAAMERLRTDTPSRDTLGESGHQAWRSRWTEEVHMEDYLRLIEEVRSRKQKDAA